MNLFVNYTPIQEIQLKSDRFNDPAGSFVLAVRNDDQKNQMENCELIVGKFRTFSRVLGTFFEPEQELVVEGDGCRFEIFPKFEPEPIFYVYVQLVMEYFAKGLAPDPNMDSSSVGSEQRLLSPDRVIEKFNGLSLLESEEHSLENCVGQFFKKLMKFRTEFFLVYELFKPVDLCVGEQYASVDRLNPRSDKSVIVFENYEFEYEFSIFSFVPEMPSRLLIGDEEFIVYFDDSFIESIGCKLYEEMNVEMSLCVGKHHECRVKAVNIRTNEARISRDGKSIKIPFDGILVRKIEDVLVKKIGKKIKLRDRFKDRKKGFYYKDEFQEEGVWRDMKSCFEFVP